MHGLFQLTMDRSEIDESEFTNTELAILDMLEEGRGTPAYIAERIGKTTPYVRGRIRELKRLGLVEKVHRGLYELAGDGGADLSDEEKMPPDADTDYSGVSDGLDNAPD